jgi:hypothetical protein
LISDLLGALVADWESAKSIAILHANLLRCMSRPLAHRDLLRGRASLVASLIGRLRSSTFRLFYLHGIEVTRGHVLLSGIDAVDGSSAGT